MAVVNTNGTEPTPQHRMLHASAAPDFLESAHEWRRLFAEAWGTFLLVVVAAGAAVVGAQSNGAITLSMKVVAPGVMVMAIIYFMGTVSGAHLNPAVWRSRRGGIFHGPARRGTSRRSSSVECSPPGSSAQCSALKDYWVRRPQALTLVISRHSSWRFY